MSAAIDNANRIILTSNKGAIRVSFLHDTQVITSYIVQDMVDLFCYIRDNNYSRLARGIYVR